VRRFAALAFNLPDRLWNDLRSCFARKVRKAAAKKPLWRRLSTKKTGVKLLIYSHFFAPSVGGVETIVLSLARGLAEGFSSEGQGQVQVTVATKTPAGSFDDRSMPFPVARRPGVPELWRLIRAADVVHVAGPSLVPLFLAWLARKPVVVEHHGYQAICPNGVLVHQPDGSVCPGYFQARCYGECLRCQAKEMSWLRSLGKLLLMFPRGVLTRKAACNIAISKHVLERQRLPNSSVVYYGIENVSGGGASMDEVSPDSGIPCFAYVGRLVPEKGLPVLLRAADILKNEGREFELLIIGDGPQRPLLQAAMKRAGLDGMVRITGFLQGQAFAKVLSRVRVVILPSVWEETAGLAAIEQMMRGRLVIASNIGGLGEVVGSAGLTCVPGSAEDLARQMRTVLADPSRMAELGAEARARALDLFLRDRMIADHARVYLQLAQ
jgi:glycogen synthase